MVCHYGMLLYETIENLDNPHAFQAFKISDVSYRLKQNELLCIYSMFHFKAQKLYKFPVSNLAMGSHYHLAIRGLNKQDETIEGMESAITFATPSCWKVHNFNTTLCRKS